MCFMGVVFFYREPVQAARRVADFKSLRQTMAEPDRETVILTADISVSAPVRVRGAKILRGNGHRLQRGKNGGRIYGGALLILAGESLSLRNITLSGDTGGKSGRGKGEGIYGRLAEVNSGKLTVGKKSALKNNRNVNQATDGGGAVRIQRGGICLMTGGEISGNQTVAGGAGVRVEAGGEFVMRGGTLRDNASLGIGAVEDFDGRGGAIYNAGSVTIAGGRLEANRARKFSGGRADYGGVGGALYNRGECHIAGGALSGNTASYGGGAVYSDSGSRLRITGGKIRGNRASLGREIYFAGDNCSIEKNPEISSVYLARGSELEAGQNLRSGRKILLVPEEYRENRCLVRTRKDRMIRNFALEEDSGFCLFRKKDGLYLRKSIYRIVYRPNGGQGSMRPSEVRAGRKAALAENRYRRNGYEFLGWSTKNRSSTHVDYKDCEKISAGRGTMVLYAVWRRETEKKPNQEKEKKVRTYFAGEFAGAKRKKTSHILPNKRPAIRVAPRYFFSWETGRNDERRWREIVWQACRIEDDCDREEDLQKTAQFQWNGLLTNRPGIYRVGIKLRDQYGHRFYMKRGEKKRYGRGKVARAEIVVTIVEEERQQEYQSSGQIRFLPVSNVEREEAETVEIWRFTSEDVERAKRYMREREDPFSGESNRIFLEKFSDCRRQRERVEDG